MEESTLSVQAWKYSLNKVTGATCWISPGPNCGKQCGMPPLMHPTDGR